MVRWPIATDTIAASLRRRWIAWSVSAGGWGVVLVLAGRPAPPLDLRARLHLFTKRPKAVLRRTLERHYPATLTANTTRFRLDRVNTLPTQTAALFLIGADPIEPAWPRSTARSEGAFTSVYKTPEGGPGANSRTRCPATTYGQHNGFGPRTCKHPADANRSLGRPVPARARIASSAGVSKAHRQPARFTHPPERALHAPIIIIYLSRSTVKPLFPSFMLTHLDPVPVHPISFRSGNRTVLMG
jgi:hypothetical protein